MSITNLVKKDLLRRKINEYFSKNPESKSVVVEFTINKKKTIWRAVKEEKQIVIAEVNTKTDKFIFEVDASPIIEPGGDDSSADQTLVRGKPGERSGRASPTTAGRASTDTLRGPTGTQVVSSPRATGPKTPSPADSTLSPLPEPMSDPGGGISPQTQADIGQFMKGTQSVISRGGWNPAEMDNEFSKTLQQTRSLEKTIEKMPQDAFQQTFNWMGVNRPEDITSDPGKVAQAKDFLSQHNPIVKDLYGETKKRSYKFVLKEAEITSKNKKKAGGEDTQPGLKEPPQGSKPPETPEVPEMEFGPLDGNMSLSPITQESVIVKNSLQGQTIQTAGVEVDNEGGTLEIFLVGSDIPAKLTWKNHNGKVVYSYKDIPYILHKAK